MRRALIFITVLLVIIAAVAAYLLLQRAPQDTTGENSVTDFFNSIFPFGNGGEQINPTDGGTDGIGEGEGTETGAPPPLRRVSGEMVAGARFINKGTSTPIIRYMERKTGHMYDVLADSYTATRITNTTVPGIDRMVWTSDTAALLQSLSEEKTPQNFLGRIKTTTQTLSGIPLSGFARAAVTGSGALVLATERENGVLVETARADGSGRQTIFASPIRSWIPLAGGTKVFLETAPSATTDGFLYELKSGVLIKVAGDMNGFMASVSPSGRYVAYSGLGSGVFRILDTEKKNFYEIPVKTLATKCGWIPKREPALVCGIPKSLALGTYPDDWLLGRVATADTLWLINPVNGSAEIIVDPEAEAGASLDIADVTVDETGSFVLFTNKNDLTLWEVRIRD